MIPHILFAAYQTDRGSNGGMESATRIFEALAGDIRWTLITNRDTSRTERWRVGGARVVRFSFNENANNVVRRIRLAAAAGQALSVALRFLPDILHGNDIRSVQMLAPAARVMQRPLAFTLRDTKPSAQSYGGHWQRAARRVDALVTLSGEMQRAVVGRLPVPYSRMRTIGSIVDLCQFQPVTGAERAILRARLGFNDDELALGLVAGVSAKKRQKDVILRVMPALADTRVRLHLIGDFGPDADEYARATADAVEEAGMRGRVVFHGYQSQVADWLRALDIVLVASEREGLARCMIEAMACATPVVSVEVVSAREMLEETGAGVVVGADDWTGMISAVRDLSNDPDRRRRMGEAGRKAAEQRFNAERIAAQWRDLYLQLARRGARV